MKLSYYMTIKQYNDLLEYLKTTLFQSSRLYDYKVYFLKFLESLERSDLHKINMYENKNFLKAQIMANKALNKPNMVNFYQRLLNNASDLPIKPKTIDISLIYKEHDTQLTINFD